VYFQFILGEICEAIYWRFGGRRQSLRPCVSGRPLQQPVLLANPFLPSRGGPYVGDRGAHNEHVVVNADGSGTETSNYIDQSVWIT
jgi:hypothetical protein